MGDGVTTPRLDYIQVLFQWLCYETGSGMFLCYLNMEIIQKHNSGLQMEQNAIDLMKIGLVLRKLQLFQAQACFSAT